MIHKAYLPVCICDQEHGDNQVTDPRAGLTWSVKNLTYFSDFYNYLFFPFENESDVCKTDIIFGGW